ncbi:MAG: GAF domain-containing protein [Candidatus Promineifilaceae bacterium]|nr:GAF domain-containing protein [Candidatus Promineifilaceae bacterium]
MAVPHSGELVLAATDAGLNLTYRSLLDSLEQIIFVVDANGDWKYLSGAWTEVTGFPVAESLHRPFGEFLHPDDREKSQRLFSQLLRGEADSVHAVVRCYHVAGGYRWFEVAARAQPDADQAAAAISGTFRDVTDKHEMQQELDDYQARLEELIGERTAELEDLNRRFQELLLRRERQVELSTDVAQSVAEVTDLALLYRRVVEAVRDRFGYYHTQLLRYDRQRDALVLVAGSGEAGRQMEAQGHEMRLGEGLIGTAAEKRAPVLRTDVSDDPDWQPNPLLPRTRGEVAVPILFQDEVLGVLDVQSDSVGALDAEDQLALEGLAGQIAIAIENTRLRQEMEERLNELHSLQRLMSREAWLRYESQREAEATGYYFDQEAVHSLSGNGQEARDGGGRKRAQAVTLPLTVRGEQFGILGVEADEEDPLSDEEMALLESISLQVAEALENARLLEQTQKRAVELETVSRVSAATSTILDADRLLQAVVELARRSFNLYHAHIYLVDETAGELLLMAGSGEAGDEMVREGWHIPVDHPASIVARVARSGEGLIVNDVRQEEGFLPNPLLPATRSELAVPMVVGNRVLGVLDVQSARVNNFTEEDVRIQSALANQVAIALQNAMLYEEQLETSERLREVDRLKSEFLASMSHELRTPLNSIIGFADVLLEGLDGQLNERMEEDVRLIRNSGEHLRDLIGDILDMSKIEAGMMELRYETIDPESIAYDLEAFARTQMMAHNKDLTFSVKVDPALDVIEGDRTRFRQVLYNLVNNAIKFTSEGGVTVSMNRIGDDVVVAVEDTGVGLESENIPIVFEQFRQVDGSLTRTVGGTGLGLPISKSLVELHGGEIWVESERGEGTTFAFTIPREKPVEQKTESMPMSATRRSA